MEADAASDPVAARSETPAQDTAAGASTGGHVCTDPSHGQHGNGNGYGHNHGGDATSPEGSVDYGGKVNKQEISSSVHFNYGWLPEGNDNAKHVKGGYGGEASASPLGAASFVWLEPGLDKKGEEMAYNDGYFASFSFAPASEPTGSTGTFYTGNGQR
ncbi:MAG: hypothetical protein HDR50_06240 [Desulfovibrio sp.]|uniref:hypothetical protein n=1 Tax=Desulfovibrio sp. TaxID=885 RepID=UPI001A73D1AF|nr:hypothetical protein [Desulfovibrio sp.]MBD5417249.1 hypothetical protein [Desulfovibrio sp.]